MTDPRELVKQELRRITDGGKFDESFWQRLYDPSRRVMMDARDERDREPYRLQHAARMMERKAITVDDHRAARKAAKQARKAFGVLRARKRSVARDSLLMDWNQSVKWISDARDAAVLIDRANHG